MRPYILRTSPRGLVGGCLLLRQGAVNEARRCVPQLMGRDLACPLERQHHRPSAPRFYQTLRMLSAHKRIPFSEKEGESNIYIMYKENAPITVAVRSKA
jgi:hypothetical protein